MQHLNNHVALKSVVPPACQSTVGMHVMHDGG